MCIIKQTNKNRLIRCRQGVDHKSTRLISQVAGAGYSKRRTSPTGWNRISFSKGSSKAPRPRLRLGNRASPFLNNSARARSHKERHVLFIESASSFRNCTRLQDRRIGAPPRFSIGNSIRSRRNRTRNKTLRAVRALTTNCRHYLSLSLRLSIPSSPSLAPVGIINDNCGGRADYCAA